MLNLDIQNHRPLREIVYEELKMQILKGQIVPGTRMMEVEMAEEMGVSRTPIREAIRKLEKEGLVTIEPRKGAYASQISSKDMVDILEVRQNMEGLAAHYAALRMTDEQKKKLSEIADSYNKAVIENNTPDMIKFDTAFHHLIVVLRFRYLYYDDFKRAEKMPREHKVIYDAILTGDTEKARKAADVHIDRLKKLVEEENI
jgi:DNA-binding GntR family transcriptional regulator